MLRRYLTPAEQQTLLRTVSQPANLLARRDAAWINALMLSGLRIEEFSRITLGCAAAALQSKYLFVPKEHRKGRQHDHSVFVTVQLRAALASLIQIRFEITGEKDADVDGALVVSRQHKTCAPMSVRSFQLRFKHWAALAGLPDDASPHWLRHTRAMNIMRQSAAQDPRGVAKAALGHRNSSSTGVYTGVVREDVEQALSTTDAPKGRRVTLTALRTTFENRS